MNGRGMALGVTAQPLLFATICNLSKPEILDGYDAIQYFGKYSVECLGMSLLSTFSAGRKAQLNDDAVNGFRDSILLSIVSLSG
jgi:hypothetical protein